mmetsp:Transcript_17049/g.25905  ORF Transcript_17049/g.25905 Transcript_17049/m.25905 type:complete len:217 (-) Transcript_17049:98-748(-)
MRSFTILAAAACATGFADAAFQQAVPSTTLAASRSAPPTALYEYIPSGFTKASWVQFKAKEQKKKDEQAKKNLGRMGPKGFQSRSFQSFQEALERGEATHLLPVENAKKRIASGELKPEDIPYMQRGGAWDNSDVKGAKKKNWLSSDKDYASGGFKKSQSVSILGEGKGLDWTGRQAKTGPTQGVKLGKNYKAPNVAQIKGGATEQKPKKKMFGLF